MSAEVRVQLFLPLLLLLLRTPESRPPRSLTLHTQNHVTELRSAQR